MSEFSLIDEPWIPIRFIDGRRKELGIRDTLARAKEIAVIEDQSPLVVASLHRLLLAVLYRALEGPTDIDQAKLLFRGGIPMDRVLGYIEKWRDRFWLFDETYPFYQVPGFIPQTWRAWTALAAEHNADNAKVLFDHVDVEAPGSVSAAAVLRWLVATQSFSVSSGKSELAHTGTAPSATAILTLPLGANLEDTLLLSLVPQKRDVQAQDLAIWEREIESIAELKLGPERAASGIADLYTWRTRSVRLRQDVPRQVTFIAFASGVGCTAGSPNDPMVAYRIDDERGRLPMQFRDRGVWRDFDSLLPDGADLAPPVVTHAVVLTRKQPARRSMSVLVLGQANNKAKIEFWRAERFTLPGALSKDDAVREHIRSLLSEAELAQQALWQACRLFARSSLSRGSREPAANDVKAFVRQMPVLLTYWSILEPTFHQLLNEYTRAGDFEDLRLSWLSALRQAMIQAWAVHAETVVSGDAWAIRAFVKADGCVRRKLADFAAEIARLSVKETAT